MSIVCCLLQPTKDNGPRTTDYRPMKFFLILLIIALFLIEVLIIRKGVRSARRQRSYYNLLKNKPSYFQETSPYTPEEGWTASFDFRESGRVSRSGPAPREREEVKGSQQTQLIEELEELEEVEAEEVSQDEEIPSLEESMDESIEKTGVTSQVRPGENLQQESERSVQEERTETTSVAQQGTVRSERSDPEEHLKMGIDLIKEDKLEAGIREIQTAIQIQPDLADAHFNLGLARTMQNNYEDAIEAYQQAIRLDPKYGKAYFNLGTLFLKRGDLPKAVECLEYAVRFLSDPAKALWNLYEAYRVSAQFDKALSILLKLQASVESEDASLLNHLGICHAKLGHYSQAIESWEKAVALGAPSQLIYYNLGKAYESQGEVEKAISNYQHFITAASTSSERVALINEVKQRLENLRRPAES